jgi:hypothetical protein
MQTTFTLAVALAIALTQPVAYGVGRSCRQLRDATAQPRLVELGFQNAAAWRIVSSYPEVAQTILAGGMSVKEMKERAPSLRYRKLEPYNVSTQRDSTKLVTLYRVVRGIKKSEFDPRHYSTGYDGLIYFSESLDVALSVSRGEQYAAAVVVEVQVPAFLVYYSNGHPVLSSNHVKNLDPFITRQGEVSARQMKNYIDRTTTKINVRWE